MSTKTGIASVIGGVLLAATVAAAAPLSAGLTPEAIKNAKTADEHRAIADAYAAEAEDLRRKAMAHRHMDSSYAEPGYLSQKLGFPRHCRALVASYEAAAKEADGLAHAHRAMAEKHGGHAK